MSKVNGHDDKKWSENIKMLIAYGIHRGGGPGSCDVHTKTSIVNGLTGEFTNSDLQMKFFIYDIMNYISLHLILIS